MPPKSVSKSSLLPHSYDPYYMSSSPTSSITTTSWTSDVSGWSQSTTFYCRFIPTTQITWKPCLCLPVSLPNQGAFHPGVAHWDADGRQTGPRSRKPRALSPLPGLRHAWWIGYRHLHVEVEFEGWDLDRKYFVHSSLIGLSMPNLRKPCLLLPDINVIVKRGRVTVEPSGKWSSNCIPLHWEASRTLACWGL